MEFVDAGINCGLCALLITLLLPVAGQCQEAPAPKPNPRAPNIAMPAPMGMQRGTALELTLTGSNLAEPTGLWTSFPAKVAFPADGNNGKENGRLRVQIEAPKDAPLGFHAIRLATKHGVSNLRLFCIDELPQVQESETNHTKATAQSVPVPCVVVGRADPEVSDYFRITVKAGQRISLEILGRRLGSPFDPQISLIDSRSQRELAYSNDAPGLQTDARLTYTFKQAGDYLIEVRDVMYRGGGDYWYRLRIGDFPCATTPIPMAANRGSRIKVHFAGPQVEGVPGVEVSVPTAPTTSVVWVTPRGANGMAGWPVALAASDLNETIEQEPNNEPAKANHLALPCGVTGRFEQKGDVDHFVFAAKKGQRLVIQAQTHELFSPTEIYMVLKNAAGNQLATSNPASDPRIDFAAPADGDYVLSVEHLNYWGGPEETYRITITPPEPGFDIILGLDRYEVPQGCFTAIPIQRIARRDYGGPIELSINGPSGISGRAVITSEAAMGPNRPVAWLFVRAQADASLGPRTCRLQGRATVNGKQIASTASARAAVSQELAGLPYPPPDLTDQIALAVTDKPPFTLTATLDHAEAIRGNPLAMTIKAARATGFGEEITLAPLGLPANINATLKNITKGQDEVKAQLLPAANAPLGQFVISFTGKFKLHGKDLLVTAAPITLTLALPFDLRVEPAILESSPGKKAKLNVSVIRKGGYNGPISLEVRNLPANVTAGKTVVEKDKSAAEIEVSAAANAVAGTKTDINVFGTATAAGNQQNASPPFTVRVRKSEITTKDTKSTKTK
jgi:hypothetical protein